MKELQKMWAAHSGKIIIGLILLTIFYFGYLKPKKKVASTPKPSNGSGGSSGAGIVHEDETVGNEGIDYGGSDNEDSNNTDDGVDLVSPPTPNFLAGGLTGGGDNSGARYSGYNILSAPKKCPDGYHWDGLLGCALD